LFLLPRTKDRAVLRSTVVVLVAASAIACRASPPPDLHLDVSGVAVACARNDQLMYVADDGAAKAVFLFDALHGGPPERIQTLASSDTADDLNNACAMDDRRFYLLRHGAAARDVWTLSAFAQKEAPVDLATASDLFYLRGLYTDGHAFFALNDVQLLPLGDAADVTTFPGARARPIARAAPPWLFYVLHYAGEAADAKIYSWDGRGAPQPMFTFPPAVSSYLQCLRAAAADEHTLFLAVDCDLQSGKNQETQTIDIYAVALSSLQNGDVSQLVTDKPIASVAAVTNLTAMFVTSGAIFLLNDGRLTSLLR
jgi:hypothetical protein